MKKCIEPSSTVKKEYLNQYQESQRALKRIEDTIYELRSFKMYPSAIIDGLPRSAEHKDLSDYAVKLDQLVARYYRQRYKRIKIFDEIMQKIEKHQDETERQLLFERYIKCAKWEDIAEEMGYSLQHIHRLHNKAIENFSWFNGERMNNGIYN